MKINKKKVIGIIIIIVGIIVCISPNIIKKFTKKEMQKEIETFTEEVEAIAVKEDDQEEGETVLDLLYKDFEKYNQNLYENGQELVDAFSYENPDFDLTQYGFSENIVGYINIPKLGLQLPIYLGATKANLYKGATLLSQTSMPIGGVNTNSVIAAHRGLIRNEMFRNIHKLVEGDTITITNSWEELTYEVCEIKIINPEDIDEILIQEGRELITLITCHPYRVNTQRYVVYAERVS